MIRIVEVIRFLYIANVELNFVPERMIGKNLLRLGMIGYEYLQNYKQIADRRITSYSIMKKQPYQKKNREMTVKDVELLNSCSQVEVLKWERVQNENSFTDV